MLIFVSSAPNVRAAVCEGTLENNCNGLLGSCTSGAICDVIDNKCQAVERCAGDVSILLETVNLTSAPTPDVSIPGTPTEAVSTTAPTPNPAQIVCGPASRVPSRSAYFSVFASTGAGLLECPGGCQMECQLDEGERTACAPLNSFDPQVTYDGLSDGEAPSHAGAFAVHIRVLLIVVR